MRCTLFTLRAVRVSPLSPTCSRSHKFFAGKPKGVRGSRAALGRYITARRESHAIKSDSRLFLASAATFDPSIADIFGASEAGCTLCMPNRQGIMERLHSLLVESRASHICATPALWEAISGALPKAEAWWSALPHLQCVALGGEAMPLSIWRSCTQQRGGGSEADQLCPVLLNTYGVTEATVYQTTHRCEPDDGAEIVNKVPIGHPLPGADAWILSLPEESKISVHGSSTSCDERCLCAPGQVGELALCSQWLSIGYLHRHQDETPSHNTPFNQDSRQLKGIEAFFSTGSHRMYPLAGSLFTDGSTDNLN